MALTGNTQTGEVFLDDWHIPDLDTFYSLGLNWDDIQWFDPSAPPPPPPDTGGGSVVEGDALLPDGRVFRYDTAGGYWRHIPDVDTANAMGVDWGNLAHVDSVSPTGPDYASVDVAAGGGGGGATPPPVYQPPSSGGSSDLGAGAPSGTLAGFASNGAVYMSDGSVWHHVPDPATFSAMGLQLVNVNWVAQLPGPIGSDLASVTGALAPGQVIGGSPFADETIDGYTFGILVRDSANVMGPPYTIPAVLSGSVTAKGAWTGLTNMLAGDGWARVQAAKASSARFMGAVS